MAQIIQGSKIKYGNSILQCVGVWWRGNPKGKGSIKDSYEFLEVFDEPQPQELLVRDAEMIDNREKEGKIKIL